MDAEGIIKVANGTLINSISGNAATATGDGSGNNIENTYIKKVNGYIMRGSLYQNNNHDANNLNLGFYLVRATAYGNLGTGTAHKNFNGDNSNLANLGGIQLSAPP